MYICIARIRKNTSKRTVNETLTTGKQPVGLWLGNGYEIN